MTRLTKALRRAECTICLQSLFASTSSQESTPERRRGARGASGDNVLAISQVSSTSAGLHEGATSSYNALSSLLAYTMENPVVVLICGHFFHHLCVLQYYESSKSRVQCPICRADMGSAEDLVIFSPSSPSQVLTRSSVGGQAGGTMSSPAGKTTGAQSDGSRANRETVSSAAGTNKRHRREYDTEGRGPLTGKEVGEEEEDDVASASTSSSDVECTGEVHRSPAAVYLQRLENQAGDFARRVHTARDRERHLVATKNRLEEELSGLQQSLARARQRYDAVHRHTSVEQLLSLRQVARETHSALDVTTQEIAAANRRIVGVSQGVEKYLRKLRRLESHSVKRRLSAEGMRPSQRMPDENEDLELEVV